MNYTEQPTQGTREVHLPADRSALLSGATYCGLTSRSDITILVSPPTGDPAQDGPLCAVCERGYQEAIQAPSAEQTLTFYLRGEVSTDPHDVTRGGTVTVQRGEAGAPGSAERRKHARLLADTLAEACVNTLARAALDRPGQEVTFSVTLNAAEGPAKTPPCVLTVPPQPHYSEGSLMWLEALRTLQASVDTTDLRATFQRAIEDVERFGVWS